MRVAILFRHVYFREFCENVAEALIRKGVSVVLSDNAKEHDVDVLLYVGVHLFADMPAPSESLVAGVQTEQLGTGGVQGSPRLQRNRNRFECVKGCYDLLFDWIPGVCQSEGRSFLPYGCSPGPLVTEQKEFDVCFIGNIHHSRREPLLKSLQQDFNFFPDFSPGFGPAKLAAIQKSRILLNIRFYEDGGFESPRMFDYLSLGAFVISERAAACDPFVPGRDFVDFEGEDQLRLLLKQFLLDERARARIAASGHSVCQQNTWDTVARQLLLAFQSQQKRASWRRWHGWLESRVRCCLFSSRDHLSLIRKTLFRG
jgi:hypothetical protein